MRSSRYAKVGMFLLVAALVERAAGNPLFLEAMLTAVRERGGSDLPDSLDALLAAQIDAQKMAKGLAVVDAIFQGLVGQPKPLLEEVKA